MNGIIGDVNFQGNLDRLMFIILSAEWVGFWNDFGLSCHTFAELGLHPRTPDRIVWERCQAEGLVLITGNRNDDGPDSLEATIRDAGSDTLPVVTIGDAQRVLEDSQYARVVTAKLMDLLEDLVYRPERVLGAGRIYLPSKAV